MTTAQIGILVALAAAACMLFAFTGWLVMRGGFRPAPAVTAAPQMTSTPFALPTLTATATPTAIPYEQLIPEGWTQHKTVLMEIWLPSHFKEVDKDADEEMRLLGPDPLNSFYQPIVIIGYLPLGTDTVDTYIDNQVLKADPTIRVVERRKVSVNGKDAIRMVLEARINTVDYTELAYLFQDGGTLWVVYYLAQINQYYEMLPVFEQSIRTFRVVQ
jgi:hypothetical protein